MTIFLIYICVANISPMRSIDFTSQRRISHAAMRHISLQKRLLVQPFILCFKVLVPCRLQA